MLTEYIQSAMTYAEYSRLEDDGTFIGKIPDCAGVWANASTLDACREELQEVLEEWIVLGFQMGHPLPVIDGIDLSFKKDEAA